MEHLPSWVPISTARSEQPHDRGERLAPEQHPRQPIAQRGVRLVAVCEEQAQAVERTHMGTRYLGPQVIPEKRAERGSYRFNT